MSRQRRTFEPDSIRESLQHNLVDGLRAIADAIERGELDARLTAVNINGWAKDDRVNVVVSVTLSADLVDVGYFGHTRLVPPTIELPAPPPSLAMQPGAGAQQQ
jgi:hypothetical protein